MSEKNRNRFESPLGVWTKTSWTSLPAKQAIIVGSSSGFNVKLLHDWSNFKFDLSKLMPVEHISLMPSLCLSLTINIHVNKLFITAHPIRNLRTPASAIINKRGQASLTLSPQSPSFVLPISYLYLRLKICVNSVSCLGQLWRCE